MNDWLWFHLAMGRDARFYEWDGRMNCTGFEALCAQGLFIRDLEAEKTDYLTTKYGQTLDLYRINNVIFGVNTENREEPPVVVDQRELIQYRINWDAWLRRVREVNRLDGSSSWLHRRLAFLGEKTDGTGKTGVVLGFCGSGEAAMDLLLGLPARMPSGYDIVVTSIGFDQLPQQDIANLERLRVYIAPPVNRETLEIDMSRLPLQPPDAQPTPSTKREGESVMRCGQPFIFVTGDRGRWNTNIILVNDYPVRLGDKLFILFLRLAVQTMRSDRGSVTKAALRTGGYLTAGAEEQTIGHLKKACTQALDNLGIRHLIESSGRGAIRLATDPTTLNYDRGKLLRHGNKRVRRLAEQLPAVPLH